MKKSTLKSTLISFFVVFVAMVFCGCPDEEEDNEPATVPVSDIKLDLPSLTLTVGETATLKAEVSPANATDMNVKWTSSSETVATVSEGKVTALKEGTATITATAGEKKAVCKVIVTAESEPTTNPTQKGYKLGYQIDAEDVNHIPKDINTELFDEAAKDKMPDNVDLTNYFPPVKSQGQYGTCVAWASGYYYRAYLRNKALKLSKAEIEDTHNQFSPKDLFWAIPKSEKGENCHGTNYKAALDVLLNRGIATLFTVPYENLGDCSSEPEESWTKEAANYKISRYRQIDETEFNVTGFKSYLSKGIPIAFGAKVGATFMYWKGGVIKSESTYEGGHAMVIVGYDDNKAAFKVINSWGTDWCEDGYIWVDYSFMFSNFIKYGFVAYSDDKKIDPVITDGDYDISPLNIEFFDYDDPKDSDSDDPTWRTIKFDIYNTGTKTIPSSMNWSTVLLYYNAYDAKDYGFLFIDYYTDKFGTKGDYCKNWEKEKDTWGDPLNVLPLVRAEGYSWNNVDIKSGQSAAEAVFGNKTRFSWPIKMPITLNGDYYLALSVDAFNNVEELDETNNMLVVANNNEPVHFVNGVPTNFTGKKAAIGKAFKVIQNANPNAYTPAEISAFISAKKKDGSLEREAKEWLNSGKAKVSAKDKIHE